MDGNLSDMLNSYTIPNIIQSEPIIRYIAINIITLPLTSIFAA
jgi:hypothetical protein